MYINDIVNLKQPAPGPDNSSGICFSKVPKKKAEGNQLCGLVAYWLKDYPESLLEVVLQLEGPLTENKNVILPLIG